ncbi:MAG: response regulator [Candidatus Zixiibacteriota bacterium]
MKSSTTILVVDDEDMMRSLLQSILSRDGYQVLVAANGSAALEVMRENDVDLIISDIRMPRMNGFELLKTVKRDYPGTGVIMMTAFGDAYSVKDAMLLGADEYITKPFKSYEISMVAERAYWRILSRQRKAAERAEEA